MTEVVAGVDGGGSKTRVVVGTIDGEVLGEATGPGSATAPDRIDESAATIGSVVRQAMAAAGLEGSRPRVLVAGVSGAGRSNLQQALAAGLEDIEAADEVSVVGDGEVAFFDAFGTGPGVLLITGTGSIAHGRGPSGATLRCGGWGPAIGDEGSGWWIGRQALSVLAAAADGREPPTELTGAVLTAAQINDVSELIPWATVASRREIAALAPVVLNAASGGDIRAKAIVGIAVEELVLHVRALAVQLFGDERAAVPVALGGGLMARGSLLRKGVEHRLKSAVPGALVSAVEVFPARGAMKWGLSLASLFQ